VTKKDRQERAHEILYGGFGRVTGPDHEFLLALLDCHSEAESKIGAGVDHFEVRPNRFKTPTFWLVRVDGSETDFSYRNCLYGKPSHRAQVLAALRVACAPQCIAFKKLALANPYQRCTITGEPLDETSEVHHLHWSFNTIAVAFAEQCGGFDSIRVTPTKDRAVGRTLADDALAERWREFHRRTAVLSLITLEAHRRESARDEPE